MSANEPKRKPNIPQQPSVVACWKEKRIADFDNGGIRCRHNASKQIGRLGFGLWGAIEMHYNNSIGSTKLNVRNFAFTLTTFAVLLGTGSITSAQNAIDLAPNGTLRVGLLTANPVLVTKKPDGTLGGVAVDLGRMIATKLGARYQEVTYQTTDTFAKSFSSGEWDVAIGPHTPVAEKNADLSAPFMLVENIYVAAPGKQLSSATEVDRAGVKIAVVLNGAPDQYLSSNLKSATLVRIDGSTPEIVEALRTGKADVYGSNAENVEDAAKSLPGSKILPGAFRTVSMVVAYPKGKSSAAQESLKGIVNEAKSSGLIQRSIDAAKLKGVRPAD